MPSGLNPYVRMYGNHPGAPSLIANPITLPQVPLTIADLKRLPLSGEQLALQLLPAHSPEWIQQQADLAEQQSDAWLAQLAAQAARNWDVFMGRGGQ